jgi:hypothetical protein
MLLSGPGRRAFLSAGLAVLWHVSPTQRVWFSALGLLGFAVAFACRSESKSFAPKPKSSAGELDAMQLEAAGRVALESAADAMERHDLERLRMLSRWVRGRAQVVLFQPNDLSALDLAIGCLDRSVAPNEALAILTKLTSGKLIVRAKVLCSEQPE